MADFLEFPLPLAGGEWFAPGIDLGKLFSVPRGNSSLFLGHLFPSIEEKVRLFEINEG